MIESLTKLLEEDSLTELIERARIIEFNESMINLDEPVYLITWAPDPKELPDCDFNLQHQINVNLLSDYLKSCFCGLFCVESTQLGIPHYHGWYQINPDYEQVRIIHIKTMQRFGIVKLVKARKVKINNYYKKSNGLYYYKKDIFDSMLFCQINPITAQSVSTIDWNSYEYTTFFTVGESPKKSKHISDRVSDAKFYAQFYADSKNAI